MDDKEYKEKRYKVAMKLYDYNQREELRKMWRGRKPKMECSKKLAIIFSVAIGFVILLLLVSAEVAMFWLHDTSVISTCVNGMIGCFAAWAVGLGEYFLKAYHAKKQEELNKQKEARYYD